MTEKLPHHHRRSFGGRDHGTVLHAPAASSKTAWKWTPTSAKSSAIWKNSSRADFPRSTPVVRLSTTHAMPVIEVSNLTKAFRTYKSSRDFPARSKDCSAVNTNKPLPSTKSASRLILANSSVSSVQTARAKTTTLKMLAGLLYPTNGSMPKSSATRRGNATTATAASSRSCSARKINCGGICPRVNRWN